MENKSFDRPLVTIAIPTFNQEQYIFKAISSALSQTYQNLEVIIADDNSSDRTGEIVKSIPFDPRLKYFRNPVSLGRVRNYRECLYSYASGDFFINLDGDDFFINNDFINNAMEIILDTPAPVLFYQARHFETGNVQASVPDSSDMKEIISEKDYFIRFSDMEHFSHMSTLINRKIALNNDFYSSNVLSTDVESLLRFCLNEKGKIILHDTISGIWRKHSANASSFSKADLLMENMNVYNDLYISALKKNYFNPVVLSKWKKRLIARNAGFIVGRSFQTQSLKDSSKIFFRIVRKHPFVLFYTIFLKQALYPFVHLLKKPKA